MRATSDCHISSRGNLWGNACVGRIDFETPRTERVVLPTSQLSYGASAQKQPSTASRFARFCARAKKMAQRNKQATLDRRWIAAVISARAINRMNRRLSPFLGGICWRSCVLRRNILRADEAVDGVFTAILMRRIQACRSLRLLRSNRWFRPIEAWQSNAGLFTPFLSILPPAQACGRLHLRRYEFQCFGRDGQLARSSAGIGGVLRENELHASGKVPGGTTQSQAIGVSGALRRSTC
jgi:hypothetical protein